MEQDNAVKKVPVFRDLDASTKFHKFCAHWNFDKNSNARKKFGENVAVTPANTEKFLAELWAFMPKNVFPFNPIDKGQLLDAFTKMANQAGVPKDDITDFFDHKKNEYDRARWQDCSKDQLARVLFLSSTSETNFSGVVEKNLRKIADKVLRGGAFGAASGMRELGHLEEASDFTDMMYMLNHLLNAESVYKGFKISRDVAPYIPCIGDWDPRAKKAISFEKVAEIQIERLRILADKAGKVGYRINKKNGLDVWQFHGNDFLFVPLVHDITTRKIFVVRRDETGHMVKTSFPEYLAKAYGTKNPDGTYAVTNQIVKEHIANMAEREGEAKGFLTGIIETRKFHKKFCCVDCRSLTNCACGCIREIGTYPADDVLKRTLENRFSKRLTFEFHTNCGYVKTAIAINDMFNELKERQLQEPSCRHHVAKVWQWVNGIGTGDIGSKADAETLADAIGLKETRETFLKIFLGIKAERDPNDASGNTEYTVDMQMALKHMLDREVINGDFAAGYATGAAERVRHFLGANSISYGSSDKRFTYLVTEALARTMMEKVAAMQKRLGTKKRIQFRIESQENGGWYVIPPSLEESNTAGFRRNMFVKIDSRGGKIYAMCDPLVSADDLQRT